jgi:hypothetical protein
MSIARRGGVDSVILISGSTGNDPEVLAGTVDPSAGGGVAAKEGSIYLRYGAGAGQIWYKTAAADTGWTQSDPTQTTTIREMATEKWVQNNVAASQAAVNLSALVSTSFDTLKMIRAGSIVGLSTRLTEAITDATADSLIVKVAINDAAGTLAISHNSGGNASGGEATQAAGIDTFVAGDEIGVELTTLGSFAPTSTDLEAILELEF